MKFMEDLSGINAAMTATLAEQFLQDPHSVSETWRAHFEAMTREQLSALAGDEAVALWELRHNGHGNGASHANSQAAQQQLAMMAQLTDQMRLNLSLRNLADTYRREGHIHANINPLKPVTPGLHVDYRALNISDADLDRPVTASDVPLNPGATVRDLIGALEATYCGTIGVEVMHVFNGEGRRWLLSEMERTYNRPQLSSEERTWTLERIAEATLLEEFLHIKFMRAKRFSVEGGESLLPMLHTLIADAGDDGVQDIVMGMAHRGRLNVMVNILGQEAQTIYQGYVDDGKQVSSSHVGRGDVKYHNGQSIDITTPGGGEVHVSLCFNPSHLEFVNPVVLGRARAKQERGGDDAQRRVMPLLIHGDAAVVGQGVVAETLNLGGLDGYKTGGTIHVVINNQIGFTTEPHDGRSTRYATDIAHWIGAPVFHVNGDDPEAAIQAARLAVAYRQRFGGDVFIDLICYRRYGHNEGDEPRFTQPAMYSIVDGHKTLHKLYEAQLIAEGVITNDDARAIVEAWTQRSEVALSEARGKSEIPELESGGGAWANYLGGNDADAPEADTSYQRDALSALGAAISSPPEDFNILRKLKRLFGQKMEMIQGDRMLDWGTAENLAYATLLHHGVSIRLSGQDVRRGTFTHRHAVLADTEDHSRTWTPLDAVARDGASFSVFNSPLSEAAVMGFDWGYSLDRPESLTIWEAQFGDFANGAQVIIDQFLASSEDKWSRLSGLVLLLPHGFEGQGPEHSSARLERFLTMCAEDNMQVCNPTTPAQIFHLLRRQVLRSLRKPLIVMSPKSLLRHKGAVSHIDDLANGTFHRILPDVRGEDPAKIKRLLICSGRVYFDLAEAREKFGADDTAIIRFEQLYPLSSEAIRQAMDPYLHAEQIWVQDEPWNMGAWNHVQAMIRGAFGHAHPIKVLSRASSASPATGWKSSHKYEAEQLMALAFGKSDRDEHDSVRLSEV